MAFLLPNWSCVSASLSQGQLTVTPFGGSPTVENSPNLFTYASAGDSVATISAANYFLPQYASLNVGDIILGNGSDAEFALVVTASSSTSVTTASMGLTTSIGTANIVDDAVTGPKLNDAMALDAPIVFSQSTSSASPGTLRNLTGQLTLSATTYANSSSSVVGLRGEVDYVGSSSGYIYGVQGKIIPTGTLSGSCWNIGVYGQLDISAATINAGQIAPIWGDYGATSGTLTDQTGCYGIAMTNTTAVVTQGQIYLYGGSQNLLLLETNAGLSGVTYFKNAGTGSGSWGNATPPTPSKVLKISVDGTAYYLPLVAQNT